MAETIVLDPASVAAGRTQLDITGWVAAAGPDWGDAAIEAYMANQAVGSSPVDYRLPNRQVRIPLNLRQVGGTSFASIRSSLQQKAALFQREGGQVMREVDTTPLYGDVVGATLHLGGSLFQAYRSFDLDAVLTLECLPDFYGDEVALDSITATGGVAAVLTSGGSGALIKGNHPARTRVIVTDTSGNDQHALLWGLRSRYYASASTSALFYEAEALTPLNGAAVATLSGASGGSAIQHSTLPASSWVPMLSTNLVSGNQPLTHQGSYRVWVRVYAPTVATLQLRLVWGVGSLSSPVTNDAALVPLNGAFCLMDLGVVRLAAPATGLLEWFGAIQANSSPSVPLNIDCVYLQPLDESAGKLVYTLTPSPAVIASPSTVPTTAANDSANGGAVAWSNTSGAISGSGATASFSSAGISEYLKVTAFGFAIPSTATINGIVATVTRFGQGPGLVTDSAVRLVKAGTVQTGDRASSATWPATTYVTASYGSATDLWATTWTPADINDSGFGVAIAVAGTIQSVANVSAFHVTIYYVLASGFLVAQDAVVYGNGQTELRTEGMVRAPSGSSAFGPVSHVEGDLPRLSPSGLEGRAVEVFVRPTRGDLVALADSSLDSVSVQVRYRPSFLYVAN